MNLPNFRDILQKLSVFKNNISLLISVIIAVVSLLLFVPTQLMSSKLKTEVEQESITNGARKISRLETSAVSRLQFEMEAERQKAHATDANEIRKLAMQTTQRELLSYDIFPAPDPNGFSGLIFQQFGQNFRSGIDKLILSVNGRDCPTDAEIEQGLENSSSTGRRGRGMSSMMTMSRDNRGMDMMYPGGNSMMFGSLNRVIIDEMCKERAKTISVYANPADISAYAYWEDYKYDIKQEDAIEDCFYHQLAYWIIDDIFQTIAKTNEGHDNVLTAPTKRFMGLTFTMGLKSGRRSGGSSGVVRAIRGRGRSTSSSSDRTENADRPIYVRDKQDALSETCTGRYCSQEQGVSGIDVTHFNFSVIVSTKSVLTFMKELCSVKEHQFRGYPDPNDPAKTFLPPQTYKHNQITILESKMGSINPDDMTHRYYRYGDEPVVSLDLICEYVFDIEGYFKIIPQPVMDTLDGKDEEDQ